MLCIFIQWLRRKGTRKVSGVNEQRTASLPRARAYFEGPVCGDDALDHERTLRVGGCQRVTPHSVTQSGSGDIRVAILELDCNRIEHLEIRRRREEDAIADDVVAHDGEQVAAERLPEHNLCAYLTG